MKKILIIITAAIVLMLLVVVFEAGILYSRNQISSTNTNIAARTVTQSPAKVPEQKGRQAIYLAETGGLKSANATLVYEGKVTDLSINDASQILKIVLDVADLDEDATFYLDPPTLRRTAYLEDQGVKLIESPEVFLELVQIGENVETTFNYNILDGTVTEVTISK